jgi:hypothetical protein
MILAIPEWKAAVPASDQMRRDAMPKRYQKRRIYSRVHLACAMVLGTFEYHRAPMLRDNANDTEKVRLQMVGEVMHTALTVPEDVKTQ